MKIYAYSDGKLCQIRRNLNPDSFYGEVPFGASLELTFDEDTNTTLVDDISPSWDMYTCLTGILYKNGTPVTINPPTEQHQAEITATTEYPLLPDWARTGTAEQAETYINNQIWNGQTQVEIDSWIDSNITDITNATVAQINTRLAAIRIALKLAAGAIITMRGLFIFTAKLLIYVRDLVIRFRK
jgi:hypothetical protein